MEGAKSCQRAAGVCWLMSDRGKKGVFVCVFKTLSVHSMESCLYDETLRDKYPFLCQSKDLQKPVFQFCSVT